MYTPRAMLFALDKTSKVDNLTLRVIVFANNFFLFMASDNFSAISSSLAFTSPHVRPARNVRSLLIPFCPNEDSSSSSLLLESELDHPIDRCNKKIAVACPSNMN